MCGSARCPLCPASGRWCACVCTCGEEKGRAHGPSRAVKTPTQATCEDEERTQEKRRAEACGPGRSSGLPCSLIREEPETQRGRVACVETCVAGCTRPLPTSPGLSHVLPDLVPHMALPADDLGQSTLLPRRGTPPFTLYSKAPAQTTPTPSSKSCLTSDSVYGNRMGA